MRATQPLATIALAATLSSPAPAQRPAALPDSVIRRADSVVVAYMTRHHVPGLSVALGLDQRLVWSKPYGLASGMRYLDYMARRVFTPAGMRHTRLDDPREIIPHRVSGYVLDASGRLDNSVHDDMSNRVPAGGFVSTPEDLVRFGIAVLNGKLVADSSRRLMWQIQKAPGDSAAADEGYGLGWALSTWYGVQEVSHGGGTPQVCALLYLLPAKGFTVAFMMNLEAVADRGDLAGDLAKVVLGPKAPHR
jgi:CubicO group peptidase (beta-lactamase class C family)